MEDTKILRINTEDVLFIQKLLGTQHSFKDSLSKFIKLYKELDLFSWMDHSEPKVVKNSTERSKERRNIINETTVLNFAHPLVKSLKNNNGKQETFQKNLSKFISLLSKNLGEIHQKINVVVQEKEENGMQKSVEKQVKFLLQHNLPSTIFDRLRESFQLSNIFYSTSYCDKYKCVLNDFIRMNFSISSNEDFSTCSPLIVLEKLRKLFSMHNISFNLAKIAIDF